MVKLLKSNYLDAIVEAISGNLLISVPKSENLTAETFEGKWSLCRETNRGNFDVVDLKLNERLFL